MAQLPQYIIADAIRPATSQDEDAPIEMSKLRSAMILAGYGEKKASKWLQSYLDAGLLIDNGDGTVNAAPFRTMILSMRGIA